VASLHASSTATVHLEDSFSPPIAPSTLQAARARGSRDSFSQSHTIASLPTNLEPAPSPYATAAFPSKDHNASVPDYTPTPSESSSQGWFSSLTTSIASTFSSAFGSGETQHPKSASTEVPPTRTQRVVSSPFPLRQELSSSAVAASQTPTHRHTLAGIAVCLICFPVDD
jgi:hypothetical protein